MERWRKILAMWGPRADADGAFYPDRLEIERPVFLHQMGPVAAAFVGARLLRAVAARGGTTIGDSAAKTLERLAKKAMSKEVVHHCEAEAERILEWIARPPSAEDAAAGRGSETPELDMMMAADVESRLSVARFALEEGYDLELEYFDEESNSWPRIRAELIGIDDSEAADFHTSLELRSSGITNVVALKRVRWLMPVPARSGDESPGPARGGEVVEFPGGDERE